MTSPEQRRERNASRRSLGTISQPQFHSLPPLYRGGAYYPRLHNGFVPHNVAQPLLMQAFPTLPQNAVAQHQRNVVGNHQPLAAAFGAATGLSSASSSNMSTKKCRPTGWSLELKINH